MTKLFADKLRKVEPYVPGEQSKNKNIIKLNANENPYPPSPKAMEAIKNITDLNKYPNSSASDLVEALEKYYGVEKGEVFVGNGSDDVIALCYLAFFNSQKPILFPDITYSFYPVWCGLFNVPYKTKAVTNDFLIDPKDYYEEK